MLRTFYNSDVAWLSLVWYFLNLSRQTGRWNGQKKYHFRAHFNWSPQH